jgi:polyhydroxyalkanoate synthesis regulator phasin
MSEFYQIVESFDGAVVRFLSENPEMYHSQSFHNARNIADATIKNLVMKLDAQQKQLDVQSAEIQRLREQLIDACSRNRKLIGDE